ncbi:hypothetical protein GH714_002000 [Hevea brasiliensis]|uniref:Peptidase A1 domain-containing protein n=1 Tax=Hevea brasiliensis TaxID=3981 RepID=A0A6A6L9L7_HEVBR|nr:hypothetical protein GH714_002000 [Hevea brasiliensis]
MKLGSQNQLLSPARGSETLFFGNELDWLHYTWIDIGTPNASFLVALDAGSNLLSSSVIACDAPPCLLVTTLLCCGRKQSGSYLDGAAPDGVI